MSIPQPKLPNIPLPTIRIPIHIPHIGCPGADATSYLGGQFGNLPDIQDALHIKHLRKVLNDKIYAFLKGKLPTILRAPLYDSKALELIAQVAEMVSVLNQVIGQAIAEYNATIGFIASKKNELNAAIAGIGAIPASALSATNSLARERYQEYVGELDAQAGRLATSISCIVG